MRFFKNNILLFFRFFSDRFYDPHVEQWDVSHLVLSVLWKYLQRTFHSFLLHDTAYLYSESRYLIYTGSGRIISLLWKLKASYVLNKLLLYIHRLSERTIDGPTTVHIQQWMTEFTSEGNGIERNGTEWSLVSDAASESQKMAVPWIHFVNAISYTIIYGNTEYTMQI